MRKPEHLWLTADNISGLPANDYSEVMGIAVGWTFGQNEANLYLKIFLFQENRRANVWATSEMLNVLIYHPVGATP